MADKAPLHHASMKRSQIESQSWRQPLLSALSLSVLKPGGGGRGVQLRGHMCVLPPSDLGLMTPEREMCSGCSFWVNYTPHCNSDHLTAK